MIESSSPFLVSASLFWIAIYEKRKYAFFSLGLALLPAFLIARVSVQLQDTIFPAGSAFPGIFLTFLLSEMIILFLQRYVPATKNNENIHQRKLEARILITTIFLFIFLVAPKFRSKQEITAFSLVLLESFNLILIFSGFLSGVRMLIQKEKNISSLAISIIWLFFNLVATLLFLRNDSLGLTGNTSWGLGNR